MRKFNKTYLFVSIFVIFCVVSMGYGVYTEYQIRDKMNRFTECSGNITSYETRSEDEGSEIIYAPVYEYLVGTNHYTITGSYSSAKPKIGRGVIIYYNPENPADAICDQENDGTGKLLFFVGLGFLLVFIGMMGIHTRLKLIPLGTGLTLLGLGMIFSTPGFAVWKVIVLIFPLLGVWMICSSLMEMTGLDKKYMVWKERNNCKGYKQNRMLQDTEKYLKENNRGKKIVNAAASVVSIASGVKIILLGAIFFGAGLIVLITAGFFGMLFGIVFMGVGAFAEYLGIRNVILSVTRKS